jgi:hypothetical protein
MNGSFGITVKTNSPRRHGVHREENFYHEVHEGHEVGKFEILLCDLCALCVKILFFFVRFVVNFLTLRPQRLCGENSLFLRAPST